jgi:hypothetical protein
VGAFGERAIDDDHCGVVTPKTLDRSRNFSIVHAPVARDGTVCGRSGESLDPGVTADGKFSSSWCPTRRSPERGYRQKTAFQWQRRDIAIVGRKTRGDRDKSSLQHDERRTPDRDRLRRATSSRTNDDGLQKLTNSVGALIWPCEGLPPVKSNDGLSTVP